MNYNKATFTIEYDFYEEREEISRMINYQDAYSKLNDIYQLVRTELKHGPEEHTDHIDRLLEEIKEISYTS